MGFCVRRLLCRRNSPPASQVTHQLSTWRQELHRLHWQWFCWTWGRRHRKSFEQSSQFLCWCLVLAAQTDCRGMPAHWNGMGPGLSAAAVRPCSGCLCTHTHLQHWQLEIPEEQESTFKNVLHMSVFQQVGWHADYLKKKTMSRELWLSTYLKLHWALFTKGRFNIPFRQALR